MGDTAAITAQPAYSGSIQKLLEREPALFIGGAWVRSAGGGLTPVHDPSTGREIALVVDSSDEDVDRAVAAARKAFDDGPWSRLPPIERERLIHRLADLIEVHQDELAELESVDNGKPRAAAAAADLPRSIATLRYMAGWATKLNGEHVEPAAAALGTMHAYVRREPIGVAAQIIPWNFPLMSAVQKIAPALAAGCTMVLKPAEQTPLTALRLADLIAEAGFPSGVVNIVTGLGETAGDRLVRHPGVDKIAFTGSTEVGKIINRNATDTLKRVMLELGGKSPFIVLPDAPVDLAAAGAARSIFSNAGQVCIAGSRLFAHRGIFDRLLEAVADNASSWKVGPSLAPDTTMGPLVSAEQRDRVQGFVEGGKKEGAAVFYGGDAPAGDGYFMNPTILIDVKPQMACVREEIFGPVLTAQRFEDVDDVARAANSSCYGLAASVWTGDISTMHRLAARLKAGMVWGNTVSGTDAALPFGGYKQSGFGREGGRYGVEAYTELKTVAIAL